MLAWVVVCLVWGTTYLAIRVAIESLPPLLMAGFRWIVAGSLLIAFFWYRGERLPARTCLVVRWPSAACLLVASAMAPSCGPSKPCRAGSRRCSSPSRRSGWSGSTRFSVMASRSVSDRCGLGSRLHRSPGVDLAPAGHVTSMPECSPAVWWRPSWHVRDGLWVPLTPDGASTWEPVSRLRPHRRSKCFSAGWSLSGMQSRVAGSRLINR